MSKIKKPADLAKKSSDKPNPELTEQDLAKVSGGVIWSYLKTTGGSGGGRSSEHDDEIEIHGIDTSLKG